MGYYAVLSYILKCSVKLHFQIGVTDFFIVMEFQRKHVGQSHVFTADGLI